MADKILVFYGSYRSDRMGIRLADYVVSMLAARGAAAELVDAQAVGLPMLDRMYKEYPKGTAPAAMEALAEKIRTADAFHIYHRRIQLGSATRIEKPDRPLPRRMVLATGCRGELFGRSVLRCAIRLDLASDPVGDGHGGGVEHARGRPDLADAGQ